MAMALVAAHTLAQSCQFNGATSSIGFGNLDPSSASDRTAFTSVKVNCNSSSLSPTWSFSGTNGNVPLRMKHASLNQFIPYSVSPSYVGNTGANQNWQITATVLGQDYQNAFSGTYSDLLTATILP